MIFKNGFGELLFAYTLAGGLQGRDFLEPWKKTLAQQAIAALKKTKTGGGFGGRFGASKREQ